MVQWLVQILKIATILVLSGLVMLGGARAFEHFQDESRPDDVGKVYSIKISQDDTPDEVAKLLEDNGLINSKTYFTGRMRVVNTELEPGSYRITKGMTVGEIIDTITGNASSSGGSGNSGGSSSDNTTLSITVIEGWRTEQIADELVALGWNGSLTTSCKPPQNYPSDNYAFLADRPEGSSLEGYLFPDTYNFNPDSSANEIIESMLNNFDAKVPQEMRDRAGEMGLSMYQVADLCVAGRARSGSFGRAADHRRYLRKALHRGLAARSRPDSAICAGHPRRVVARAIRRGPLRRQPYNTYQVDGLPPGPIANPGYASIRAVLFPADSPYYYFFAKADGRDITSLPPPRRAATKHRFCRWQS